MLKIIEVHLAASAQGEYVVLQNQGLLTLSTKGHALASQAIFTDPLDQAVQEMFLFTEDIAIRPYGRVVLFTGEGPTGWRTTNDGKQCYVVHWGRTSPVWRSTRDVYLLSPASHLRVPETSPVPTFAAAGG